MNDIKDNAIKTKSYKFALDIVNLNKKLIDKREYVLSRQLLKAGTSIGANVEEAIAGSSVRDFRNKMSISLKEARETRYWLNLLTQGKLTALNLETELQELNAIINILYKIVKTSTEKSADSN